MKFVKQEQKQSTSTDPHLFARLMQAFQSVKTDTKEAKLNETSMSDNNGDRIIYTIIKGVNDKRPAKHQE